jgi:8-oxo-(d)GTP phosphatase
MKDIRGAGAVVWRPATRTASAGSGGEIEVLVVHRKKRDDWSFPRGRLPKNEPEHPVMTAVREVHEEAFVDIRIGRCLGAAEYPNKSRKRKMLLWAAELVREHPFELNEVDLRVWLPVAEARDRLTYGTDHKILEALTACAPATVPVIFVRNADDEHEEFADDDSRLLSAKGAEQATMLSELLGYFGELPVLSSSARRCITTVESYAARHGQRVSAHTELSRKKFDATAARELVENQIEVGTGVIVCSHRRELPELATQIFGSFPDVSGNQTESAEKLRHAEFVVFHLDDQRRIVARERFAWK